MLFQTVECIYKLANSSSEFQDYLSSVFSTEIVRNYFKTVPDS